jgi:hypothetical protein
MAKIIKKSKKAAPASNSRDASGAGYRRNYSDAELETLERKRREMHERLYAAG